MAAVITLSSVAIATDGKTITATCGGGTGPYTITNANGLTPHLSAGNAYGFTIASVSMSSPTLTINLATPIGSGETVKLDVTAASATLGDASANTAATATNTAITNNSAVTVATVLCATTPGAFEINGSPPNSGGALRFNWWLAGNTGDYMIEFVTDATEVAFLSYSGATSTARVDGGSVSTLSSFTGFWCAKAVTTSALAAGKHLFLLSSSDYVIGVRLSGGTMTMYTVPTAKQTVTANTLSAVQVGATTTVSVTGTRPGVVAAGSINTGLFYEGTCFEVGFTGTGSELAGLVHNNSAWSASIDGGYTGALIFSGDASVTNANGLFPLAVGLSPGAHTMTATHVGCAANTTHFGMKVINGTKLSAGTSISDTTFQVPDTTYLHVNDWVKIDRLEKREWRQITAITGTGPYTVTVAALAIAHAAGVAVTSYEATAGSFSSYVSKSRSSKVVVAIGDSNTEGANEYGIGGTPDANGVYYSAYDPRQSAVYQATELVAGTELINLGIQGTDTVNQAGRAADISTYSRGSADYVVIWEGVNDINANTTTSAQYSTNVQTQITAAAAILRPGGKIILVPPFTPNGTTSAKGLNIAACATALQTLQAANPTTCVYAGSVIAGLVLATDVYPTNSGTSLHYTTTGRQKIAAALAPYLGLTAASNGGAVLLAAC